MCINLISPWSQTLISPTLKSLSSLPRGSAVSFALTYIARPVTMFSVQCNVVPFSSLYLSEIFELLLSNKLKLSTCMAPLLPATQERAIE